MAEGRETDIEAPADERRSGPRVQEYIRFGAMIVTAMAVMYALTYVNTHEAAHVRWSEQRLYMTMLMGAAMAVVMLLFMLGMYSNWRANIAILVGSALLFTTGAYLVRSQSTIEDGAYMSSMIPHHSIAILTSERSQIRDVRVCRLAVAIIEAQRREISEMEWLLADIGENGPAETPEEAAARPVPVFEGRSLRECGG